MAKKLNQIIAVEKGEKALVTRTVTDIYKKFDKPVLFNGQNRRFVPMEDTSVESIYPAENITVQERADGNLEEATTAWIAKLDVTLTKDNGNTQARADIVLDDGTVIAKAVPAPYLVWLEKELTDMQTFIGKIPTLNPAVHWKRNENTGLHESEETRTVKTKKTSKALVLYPATEKHPAQTQMITEDVAEGYWVTSHVSGAIPSTRRDKMYTKTHALLKAVKTALEAANSIEVKEQHIGKKLFDHILG